MRGFFTHLKRHVDSITCCIQMDFTSHLSLFMMIARLGFVHSMHLYSREWKSTTTELLDSNEKEQGLLDFLLPRYQNNIG